MRAEAQTQFNQALAGSVYGAAFAFMAPRTLAPIPIAKLTLWGLRGLTALDPAVGPTISPRAIMLVDRERVALTMPLPSPTDAAAWGAVAAALCEKAASLSPAIAEAGTGGIVTSFFDELFNHLDPYSRYIAPEGGRDQTTSADVGLVIGVFRHRAVVARIVPEGSAAAAGLVVGEQVLAIDGVSTRGQDAYALNNALSGPAGSEVTLSILPHHSRPRIVSLPRIPAAPETVFAARQGPMLVVQITGFERGTAEAFRRMLTGALATKPDPVGIVIDLRGNRGGLLDQAVGVADSLIDSGIIARAVGRDPAANQLWQARGPDIAAGRPLAVLVDGRTASAAEVLAAALADDGRGVVIGSATFGKGLVQAATRLPDNGTLLVTWARLLAPLGWPLQGLGVMPQICTSGSSDSVEHELEGLSAGQQPLGTAIRAERAARPGISLNDILRLREACPAALGSSLDLQTAQFLLKARGAYATALLTRP
ncbi:MAG: PDZ domain-containing protein [Proteobacteria bacterium]|nr:PDZ domain-containing protein [Pseudomonadota bacterium]